jgi:hypothetical protein
MSLVLDHPATEVGALAGVLLEAEQVPLLQRATQADLGFARQFHVFPQIP